MKMLAAVLSVALLLGVAGCSPSSKPAKTKGDDRPVTITAGTVQAKDVPVRLSAIGTVKAFATVEVRSMVRGPLARADFKEGEEIKQGDQIFLIDPRPFEAAVEQAKAFLERDKAQLVRADADYRRAAELMKDKTVSESVFDQARAALDTARATVAAGQAALNSALLQLSYCQIKSPVTGRIGTLLVNVGNVVKESDTLLAVVNQTRPVYVDFSVPEQVLAEVRQQMARSKLPVHIALPGTKSGSVTGELAVVNNAVDTTTGTVLLRAVCANDAEVLWPGQFVNVSVTLAIQPGALVVPAAAIQVGQQGAYVFLIQDDQTVAMQPVTTGAELDGETVITAGLQPGQRVVTSNHLRLKNGAKVQPKEK